MDVKVYTTKTCPYCTMLKQFLVERGVKFQEIDVNSGPAYAQELLNITGEMGVPVTIIDNETIIGFDRNRLQQILDHKQTTERPIFGAAIADAAKITAKQGREVVPGAYVGAIKPHSFAARVGLMPGDIVTGLNSTPITNSGEMEQALSVLKHGSHVLLYFVRGSQPLSTEGIF